jgi:polyketide cyclase/dehydrase/lipid transport protein
MPGSITVPVEGAVPADVETTFDALMPIDLSRIFRGYGPLPAVVATTDQTGPWDHVGVSRTVKLSDGNDVRERITAYERPAYFAYRLGPFDSGALRHLVVEAHGEWRFTAQGDASTAIRWTYTFGPRRFAALAVRLIVAPLWRAYAKRVLALAIAEIEGAGPRTGPREPREPG